ncbi:FAD binding domain-containing protein [Mycena polygramma]|nr:FAD binding domain-containing protein [Mycena polygramma]
MDRNNTDVVIVGAGPAGLMAALVLASMDVKVRLLDRRLPNETSGQADGIQPRMIEIWESLGLGSDLRERSEHVYRMVTYVPTANRDGIELKSQMKNIPVPTARYQYEILARIDIIEDLLRAKLRAKGVSVEHLTVPVSLEYDAESRESDPVKISVARLNAQVLQDNNLSQEARGNTEIVEGLVEAVECIAAKFVIGCDGGKSWIRRQLNIPMEGNQTDLDWGVIDFTPQTDFPTPRAKNIIQSPLAGALGYLPRPKGAARAYVMLGEGLAEKTVPAAEAKTIIADKLRRGFAPYRMEIENATWCTIFRASQRVAERFSDGRRIFLAGDACHTHSPKAGQGANASMSDTFNLAWKIGYVVRHAAQQHILDTYEAERRPHSLELIELDRKIFRLFRGQTVAPEEYTRLWQEQIMFASGIGLQYSSVLIDNSGQSLAPGLVIGERLPSLEIIRTDDWRPVNIHDVCLFTGRFHVFLLAGNILEASQVIALETFSRTYVETIEHGPLSEMLQAHVVIDNDVNAIVETTAIQFLAVGGRYDSVYFGEASGLYHKCQVSTKGIAFLVRPDNHVCAIATMDDVGMSAIERYFSSWM